MKIERGEGWELRLGDWREVLGNERGDAVVTDPPYTVRNIIGFRSGSEYANRERVTHRKPNIPYAAIGEDEARELVEWATSGAARWWLIAFNDHIGWDWLERAVPDAWNAFAPVVWAKTNGPPRMAADGPSSDCEHILVARPRVNLPRPRKRNRPGHYVGPIENARASGKVVVGGKPVWLMRDLIRDYTEPGDLILEPYAGGATTLIASVLEGRRAIGAERDVTTWKRAVARLRRIDEQRGAA